MSINATSFKAQIRNLAKKKNVKAQILLQNYMFERFLERLSLSDYKDKFVLKGGLLISAIVGIDTRTTMDLDATMRGLPFTEESISNSIKKICSISIEDDVTLVAGNLTPIRPDDKYGGYRMKITAKYATIETPFSIDISTGDIITPQPVKYILRGIFNDEKQIEVWAYNIETVLSEKVETVLRRSTLNTRARDFYDIYILCTTQAHDAMLLREAFAATANHRGTVEQVSDIPSLLKQIEDSTELKHQWEKYRREFDYATDISYEQVVDALRAVSMSLIDPSSALVYIRVLVKSDEHGAARQALEKYANQIKSISIAEWVDISIWVAVRINDISFAYHTLEQCKTDLQADEYMRSLLYVMNCDETKKPNDIIKQATKNKDSYKQPIDFRNLCSAYMRFNKWSRLLRIAKQWMKMHQDIEALLYFAEAQFYMNKMPECLNSLTKLESHYELSAPQKILKLNCLSRLSQFDEALILVNELGDIGYADESLIVHKATLEFSSGSLNEAVRTLRLFIDSNDDAIEAVRFLAKLLSVDHPKEAYQELRKLYEKHPDNTEIALNTMHQGFAAGYDEEASKIMWKVVRSRPDEKHFKALKSDEMIAFFEKAAKANAPIYKMHEDGLLPNHAMIDKNNGGMGYSVYSKWMLSGNAHMLWAYGGRAESVLDNVLKSKKLILDYSAILSIEYLDLFGFIEKLFDKVFVSPRLIIILHQEIGRLKNVQESVKKHNDVLYRHFQNKKQRIKIVDDCLEFDETLFDVEQQDRVLYFTADKNNAYIVTDSFACEMFHAKPVPNEVGNIQIYESELLTYLISKNLYPNKKHTGREPRQEKIDELNKQSPAFLVNEHVLGILAENADLSTIASVVPLIIPKSVVERILHFNESVSKQDDAVQWLRTLHDKLVLYRNKGFIEFCPHSGQQNSVGDLTDALFDCVSHSCETATSLWVDDRWANGMSGTGGATMFGVYDFVHTIYQQKIINEFEYQRMLGYLMKNNVFFHVPPNEYVYMLLKIATEDSSGDLQETAALSELRRYVATALSVQSCIGKEPRADIGAIPEIYGFILLLNRLYCALLERIWNEDSKGVPWKRAAASWVWQHLSDFVCDVNLSNRISIEDDIASKHMFLLTCLFRVNPVYQNDCSEWVFYKLYSYWLFHPSDKQKTADIITTAIFGDGPFKETPLERDRFEQLMLAMCQKLFPLDFMALVLDNPLCKTKWGDSYETIQVEVKHIEYPMPISDDNVEYESGEDFVELLFANPMDWKEILQAVIHYGNDDGIDTVIAFFNSYIEKHDADTIERDCMKAVEFLMLHSPVECRVRLRELLRKF